MRAAPTLAILALLACPSAAAQDAHAAKDPRNLTWIAEGQLALGGGGLTEADVDWLASAGFGAIADLREEHEDPQAYIEGKGMAFLDLPIDSASNVNETQLASFVAWVREQNAAGRSVYVHCTNGWHRAAAFALAFDVATERESVDQAASELMRERPGAVMRAISALLDYEATLTGAPQLAVVLVSPVSRPEPGGTMSVSVDAYANGAPAAGARVRVWSEESKMRLEGVTGADGRYTFTYTAPVESFMDHLYGRASLEGYADGADNVEFIFGQKVAARGPLAVAAERTSEGLFVRVASGIPVRVVANAPGWTAFESSDRGAVTFRDAPSGPIDVRVVSWGSEGGVASVAASPAAAPPPAPAGRLPRGEIAAEEAGRLAHSAPPSPRPGVDATPPLAPHAHSLAARYAIVALAGALVLGAYVVASRRRSGVGNR